MSEFQLGMATGAFAMLVTIALVFIFACMASSGRDWESELNKNRRKHGDL